MQKSRDRLALLLGLILMLAAVGLVVLVAWPYRLREGNVDLVKGLTVRWASIKFFLVVAGLLLAPAGLMLAVLGWRKGIIALNVEVMIVLCIVLLAIVSYINNRYYRREDWTRKARYGLSDQTIQLLKEGVKQKLTITTLLTPNPENADLCRHLIQILKEYKSYCGNVDVVTWNPDVNLEQVTEMLKRLDIKTVPALIIEYGDRHEEVTPGSLIEYPRQSMMMGGANTPKFKVEEEVTSAIMKLTEDKPIELCFTTGHGERDPDDYGDGGLADVRKQLEKSNYKIKKIDLAKDTIPEGCVLIVAGPKKAGFQEVELDVLRNFLGSEKGRLMALIDPISETGSASGLAPLFQDYDATLREDVTVVNKRLDLKSGSLFLSTVTQAYCDPSVGGGNDIVSKMQGYAFALPRACAIETKPSQPGEPPNERFMATVLLRVAASPFRMQGDKTPDVWGETDLKENESLEFNADKGDIGQPVTVGVAVQPAPPRPPSPGMPPPPPEETPTGPRIVLIGDSDFATNSWVKDRAANANLFSNCTAWLAAKKAKLGIPPKDIDIERLDRDAVEAGTRPLSLFLFVVLVPTMVGIVLGSLVWVLRRK